MAEGRLKNAKRNIVGALGQRVVSLIFPFVLRTVMIYYLGALYMGLSGLFTSILQVLSLAELGIGEAMIFSMYEPIAQNDIKKICALLNLYKKIYKMIGLGVLIIGLGMIPFLQQLISGTTPADVNIYVLYIIYLMNTVVSYIMYGYKSSIFIANQRYDIKNKISMVTSGLLYCLQIMIVVITKNYYLYCILIPIITIIDNVLVNTIARQKYPELYAKGTVEQDLKNDIKKRVVGLFIYKICGVFRNSFDSIIISAFLGLVILAKYQNYYYIITMITGIMGIITSSVTAGIGNSVVTETVDKNYNDFNKFQFIYMWIVSWCTVCLFCLYQPFMKLWVGANLMFSDNIMVVFCVYFFTSQMGNICFTYRQAAGLWWQDKIRPLIEAIVNLVFNIILVQYIGVVGVLLSTILCLVLINCVWGTKILYKYYFTKEKLISYLGKLMIWALITIISVIATNQLCQFIKESQIYELILRFAICLVVPNVIILLLSKVLPEYKNALIFIVRDIIGLKNIKLRR